ncbi:MAG: aspartate ammonia-lyase [Eubacteriaceae bacterium]|nr:aspartate ammonia-lyase [Eubacteriaceae bacterium]
MCETRMEKDILGVMEISRSDLFGINTARAASNFKLGNDKVSLSLIYAVVMVKKAAAMVNQKLGDLSSDLSTAMIKACDLIFSGGFDDQFVLHPLQGGAGTSINMNVNEVIANIANIELGGMPGDYTLVHPMNHVNMSQSTNDVFPTAIRIAAIYKIRALADVLAALQSSLQQKENDFSDILKLGRTQMMDALPITLGQEFGAYARAISRDRWRIYKVEERLRETNIGGTAIGTGLNAKLEYIYMVTEELQKLTGLGLARSDLLVDTTQNMDVFAEVSGFLKACAVNLIKISNDLRLMSSGPRGGLGEIHLEALQQGSTIMPGKVNPVMCEMMIQVCYRVIGNDSTLTAAAYSGSFELNPFSPLIAHTLLESLDLMIHGITQFNELCIKTLKADKEKCLEYVVKSSALAAALIGHIGYDEAASIAKEAYENNTSIKDIVIARELMGEEELNEILDIYQVTKPGIPGRKKK